MGAAGKSESSTRGRGRRDETAACDVSLLALSPSDPESLLWEISLSEPCRMGMLAHCTRSKLRSGTPAGRVPRARTGSRELVRAKPHRSTRPTMAASSSSVADKPMTVFGKTAAQAESYELPWSVERVDRVAAGSQEQQTDRWQADARDRICAGSRSTVQST